MYSFENSFAVTTKNVLRNSLRDCSSYFNPACKTYFIPENETILRGYSGNCFLKFNVHETKSRQFIKKSNMAST